MQQLDRGRIQLRSATFEGSEENLAGGVRAGFDLGVGVHAGDAAAVWAFSIDCEF
jgi:hypothetical protein